MAAAGLVGLCKRQVEPAAKLAAAHRRAAAVEHGEERGAPAFASDRVRDLKVASTCGVDDDVFGFVRELQRADERNHVDLSLGCIVEKRVGGCEHARLACHAPGVKVVEAERLLESFFAVLGIEVPGGHRRHGELGVRLPHGIAELFGDEDLGGRNARHFGVKLLVRHLGREEVAVREREPGKAPDGVLACGSGDGEKHRVVLFRKKRGVRKGARRDDARDAALHQALARRAELLGDHDGLAESHEAGDVLVERDHRNAGHRNRIAVLELSALRERDADQAVGLGGVVEERLVEVTHAKQDERLGVPALHLDELTHRRREVVEVKVFVVNESLGHGIFRERRARMRAPVMKKGRTTNRSGPSDCWCSRGIRPSGLRRRRAACPRAAGAGRRCAACRRRRGPVQASLRRPKGR